MLQSEYINNNMIRRLTKPGIVAATCHSSILGAEARRLPSGQGQPWLCSEFRTSMEHKPGLEDRKKKERRRKGGQIGLKKLN